MAKSKIIVDFELLKRLCQRPISGEDVAAKLGYSKDTLERAIKKEYGTTLAAFKEKFQVDLRLTILDEQFKILRKGNASMAIWLGKQYCGQKDKTEISNEDVRPFTLAYSLESLKKDSNE